MLKLLDFNPFSQLVVLAVFIYYAIYYAEIAQSVEQRTENPRVDGSIPPLGTTSKPYIPCLW